MIDPSTGQFQLRPDFNLGPHSKPKEVQQYFGPTICQYRWQMAEFETYCLNGIEVENRKYYLTLFYG